MLPSRGGGPLLPCRDAARLATRVCVWLRRSAARSFDGPVKTLDVGSVRDRVGRFYNERGAAYSLVHQFRQTRQRGFVAELGKIFPPRAVRRGGEDAAAAEAEYGRDVAWRHKWGKATLQRAPFVWDDKRRMEKLVAQHRASGTPNPADATRPLPELRGECVSAAERFAPCAHRDETGKVHGAAWEALAAGGFVRAEVPPVPH